MSSGNGHKWLLRHLLNPPALAKTPKPCPLPIQIQRKINWISKFHVRWSCFYPVLSQGAWPLRAAWDCCNPWLSESRGGTATQTRLVPAHIIPMLAQHTCIWSYFLRPRIEIFRQKNISSTGILWTSSFRTNFFALYFNFFLVSTSTFNKFNTYRNRIPKVGACTLLLVIALLHILGLAKRRCNSPDPS